MFFSIKPIVRGLFPTDGKDKFMAIGRNSVKPKGY